MHIFVKADHTHGVEVHHSATLEAVGKALGMDLEEHYFTHCSRILKKDVSLLEMGIGEDSTLEAHLRLMGGGKKRKKKTYTKPKKPQHKRQHEKLRVLKMYKVEGQKVVRCKKQCPTCGPGVFMATHFDRVHCGRCTTTYLYENNEDGE